MPTVFLTEIMTSSHIFCAAADIVIKLRSRAKGYAIRKYSAEKEDVHIEARQKFASSSPGHRRKRCSPPQPRWCRGCSPWGLRICHGLGGQWRTLHNPAWQWQCTWAAPTNLRLRHSHGTHIPLLSAVCRRESRIANTASTPAHSPARPPRTPPGASRRSTAPPCCQTHSPQLHHNTDVPPCSQNNA